MAETEQALCTTLIINRSDTKCGNCGKGADPYAESHDVILGYPPIGGGPGCGVRWAQVRSDYTGMEDRCREMRPDLEWVGTW
jgi:hypothetical protein